MKSVCGFEYKPVNPLWFWLQGYVTTEKTELHPYSIQVLVVTFVENANKQCFTNHYEDYD